MNWRIALTAFTGVLSLVSGLARLEKGGDGFLVWAPLLTAALSFAAMFLMWRATPPKRRNPA